MIIINYISPQLTVFWPIACYKIWPIANLKIMPSRLLPSRLLPMARFSCVYNVNYATYRWKWTIFCQNLRNRSLTSFKMIMSIYLGTTGKHYERLATPGRRVERTMHSAWGLYMHYVPAIRCDRTDSFPFRSRGQIWRSVCAGLKHIWSSIFQTQCKEYKM